MGGTKEAMMKHLSACESFETKEEKNACLALLGRAPVSDNVISASRQAASSSSRAHSSGTQSLLHSVPLADMGLSAEQKEEFDMLILRGTLSANLPWQWTEDVILKSLQ